MRRPTPERLARDGAEPEPVSCLRRFASESLMLESRGIEGQDAEAIIAYIDKLRAELTTSNATWWLAQYRNSSGRRKPVPND